MTVLNDSQIEEITYAYIYDEDDEPRDEFDGEDFWGWLVNYKNEGDKVQVGEHEFELVTYNVSGEDGDTYAIVKIDGTLYRKDGWYASHDGEYWDGRVYPTKPVEKMITVWVRA